MIPYLVFFLALMSVISLSINYNLQTSFNINYLTQINNDKLLLGQWANSLRNNLIYDEESGRYLLLAGENINQDIDEDLVSDIPYYTLPSSIVLSKKNAFGRYFVYCPSGNAYDNTLITTFKVNNGTSIGDSTTYYAATKEVASKSYIIQSEVIFNDSIPSETIGLIISPLSTNGTSAGCNDVTYNGKSYLAPNSVVAAVSISDYSNPNALYIDVANSDVVDLIEFNSKIKASVANKITLDFGVNNFALSGNLDLCFESSEAKRKVYLKGGSDGSNSTVLSGAGSIKICNADVYMKNVSLSGVSVSSDSSSVTLDSASISDIEATSSKLNIKNSVSISPTGSSALKIKDSEINASNAVVDYTSKANSEDQIALFNSKLILKDSFLITNKGNGIPSFTNFITIDPNSSLIIDSSTITDNTINSGSFIKNSGKLNIANSKVTLTSDGSFVTLNDGATMVANDSNISALTSGGVVILDDSGLAVYGKNVSVIGYNCWSGALFSDTASKTTGSSESVNELVFNNKSNWSCN